jgi:hypothetical protein
VKDPFRRKEKPMKYVLMFTHEPALLADVDPGKAEEVYGKIYAWYGEHQAEISDSGAELQPAETATTVKHGGVVVDGPFNKPRRSSAGSA